MCRLVQVQEHPLVPLSEQTVGFLFAPFPFSLFARSAFFTIFA